MGTSNEFGRSAAMKVGSCCSPCPRGGAAPAVAANARHANSNLEHTGRTFLESIRKPIVARIEVNMNNQQPPPWDDDSLSRYFRDAQHNERIAGLNHPAVWELLQRVQQLFERAEASVEKGSPRATTIPRILLVRARAAILAATRLGMAGQSVEGQVLLRTAIEAAWYALHIAKDPAPHARVEIWLRRHESDEATARSRQEFSAGNVRKTHEAVDADAARLLHSLYETLIDFGAHPNQRGVLGAIKREEDEEKVTFNVAILQPDPLRMMMTLKVAVAVACGVLRIFGHLYPERFAIVGLDYDVCQLEADADAVFRQYVQR